MLAVKVIGGRNWNEPSGSKAVVSEAKQYIVVEFGGQKQTTKVYSGPAGQPNFNETFHFDACNLWHEDIILTAYRKGAVSDTKIGQVRLKLEQHKDVPFKFALDHWYPFGTGGGKKEKDKKQGKKKKTELDPESTSFSGEVGVIVGTENAKEALLDGAPKDRYQVKSLDDPYLQTKSAEEIYDEAIDQAKEDVEIVNSMVRMGHQTKEVAENTINKLEHQNEQLGKINTELDNIEDTMDEADRKIKSIGNCCYTCYYCCCSGDEHKNRRAEIYSKDAQRRAERKQRAIDEQAKAREQELQNKARSGGKGVAHLTQEELGNMTHEEKLAYQQSKIDSGLDELGEIVGDLKNMAQNMGDTIDQSMPGVDELPEKIDHANTRVVKDTVKVKSLK